MIDIARILTNAGIAVAHPPHKNVREGWIGADCPKCSPNQRKFRLGFELDSNRAHCWVCGSFYAPAMLATLLRITIQEAHGLLGKSYSAKRSEAYQRAGALKIPDGVGDLWPAHQNYLRDERRLDPDEIQRVWGVRATGPGGRLPWRLWIPVHDKLGRIVSWTTRSIGKENKIRYLAAGDKEEEVHHKHLLYGAEHARHTIVVVEGPIDAWTIGQGCVATLGVGYTPQQKYLMSQYPIRYVCFDSEDDAQRRAYELCCDLCAMPGVTQNLVLESGKDANSADPAEVQALRELAFPERHRLVA